MKYITKRDGRKVDFDHTKVVGAIEKAGKATGEFGREIAHEIASSVFAKIYYKKTFRVEEIQDIIEEKIMFHRYHKTAKTFILYRAERKRARDMVSQSHVNLVDNYISKNDWKVKENSNQGYSLQGLNNYISSDISKTYWLNEVYTPEIMEAHESGDMHIHDCGTIAPYCMGHDLQDLLRRGFGGVEGKIESKPAKHLRSALGQLVNFMYTMQGEAAGAIAVSNFDTLLSPFICYDKLDYSEVKQAIQEFVFNMNVPTRVGFQSVFSNITIDLQAPSTLKDQPVIIGGKLMPETYADFQPKMDVINKAFAEVMMEGDAKGRVFTFPIPTYNITKEFDWDNPAHDLIWKMTGKYGIPSFANYVNSNLDPKNIRSMCCRLSLDISKLQQRGGGLFGASPKTGSLGVVTINLPRIGYVAENKDEFVEILSAKVRIALDSLKIKREFINKATDAGLFPYTSHYMADVQERYGSCWQNHFSTIGIIGMNEALLNLIGKDIGTDEGRKFALDVLDELNNILVVEQKETGTMMNCEQTPGEGISFSLPLKDKKLYPDIIVANEEDYQKGASPYYSNSTHLPVNYTDDIYETLMLQDELQTKYTGGGTIDFFLGEEVTDTEVIKLLIKKITSQFRLPYFTLTPIFSICPSHGYLAGKKESCPSCGGKVEQYQRVVGYLRPVESWNPGKQAEAKDRKVFKI